MGESVWNLAVEFFPAPGAWGAEYLAVSAGAAMAVTLALFFVCWVLDAVTEGLRPVIRKRPFAAPFQIMLTLVVVLLELAAAYAVYTASCLPVCRHAVQYLMRLSYLEMGLLLGGSLLAALWLWRLFRNRWIWLAGGLLVLGAGIVCWRFYGEKPTGPRLYATSWRECVALFVLGGLYLATFARAAWRRWRGWKVYVPKIAWLAFAFFWLRGIDSVWDVPRLARVSAGAVCGSAAPARIGGSGVSPVALSGNDLQAAINEAPDGAIINVPAGTYGPICTYGRALTLRAVDGPERTVLDAAPGKALGVTNRCATLCSPHCASRLERLVATTQRANVLQLDFLKPMMGEGRTAPETLPPGGASVLEGFTLRGGHADCGGGALGGTLVGCVLERNLAEFCGAGAFGSRLERCTIRGNAAGWMGGGVWGGCSKDCAVEGNAAGDFGGGVWGGAHEGLSAKGNRARHYADTAAVP